MNITHAPAPALSRGGAGAGGAGGGGAANVVLDSLAGAEAEAAKRMRKETRMELAGTVAR